MVFWDLNIKKGSFEMLKCFCYCTLQVCIIVPMFLLLRNITNRCNLDEMAVYKTFV